MAGLQERGAAQFDIGLPVAVAVAKSHDKDPPFPAGGGVLDLDFNGITGGEGLFYLPDLEVVAGGGLGSDLGDGSLGRRNRESPGAGEVGQGGLRLQLID